MSDDLTADVLERAVRAQERVADRRERIATAALTGLLAYPIGPYSDEWPIKGCARRAVEYADALIAELDKEGAP